MFELIARYFWLICIAITCLNAFIWWHRSQPELAKTPHLAASYRRLILGWVIFGNIPWLVMGVGILFGGVPGFFHYLNANNGPFVIAWYVSMVALWLLGAWWLFARRGAEQIVEHRALLRVPVEKPEHVKAWFLASVALGTVVLCAFIFGGIDVDQIER